MATDPQPVASAAPAPRRRGCGKPVLVLLLLALVAAGIFALWAWITLSYDYADGERAGFVQKFSNKGWICKTWEGELAMVNLPGAMPEIFRFSVRDDAVAEQINQTMGQRVTLHYEQHVGVPTSCFGETDYYVTDVRSVKP
ncbi:MAG TPA: hypothetical protein VF179_28080 [Thermoanaerobaculia bacterium]|nr:hypothetical protein [Thermoanaerobaculia bacterium]